MYGSILRHSLLSNGYVCVFMSVSCVLFISTSHKTFLIKRKMIKKDEYFVGIKAAEINSKSLPNLLGVVAHAVIDDKSHSMIENLAKRKKNVKPISEKYFNDKESIRRRLNDSDRVISVLMRDGRELIQDIRVANDKREIERRVKEAEIREELLEKLQTESAEAVARFESISDKWDELKELKDPMAINDSLQIQKDCIHDLMKQKDIIIEECRRELKLADERYTHDLQKQTMYIHSLVERVDSQVDIMKRAFNEHLELLEHTIDEERHILRIAASRKWDDLYSRRAINERIKMKQEKERLDYYRDEIDHIELEYIEMTRATRIRLEKDNQALEIELQKIKTNTTLNTEKLDYNFQVLKKREGENMMVRNAQKRRLTKLNETIFVLRRKIKNLQMNCLFETKKLTSDVIKLRFNINQLTKKSYTFAEVHDKKYKSIWKVTKNECAHALKSIFEIDKLLVEQHLGLKWQAPDYNVAKTTEQLFSLGSEIIRMQTNANASKQSLPTFEDLNDRQTVWDILQALLQQTGFLIDKTTFEIMEQCTKNDQTLMCLDTIFDALGVTNWNEITKLKEKFGEIIRNRETKVNDFSSKSDGSCTPPNEQSTSHVEVTTDKNVSISILTPSEKLSTLKNFSQHLNLDDTIIPVPIYGEISGKIPVKEVKKYWDNFRNMFSPDRVKVWYTMEDNLSHYLKILKERKKRDEECEFLRKQNMELQHLLLKMQNPKENPLK